MKKLTVDEQTIKKLLDAREELELMDEHGRRLGSFTPHRSLPDGVDSPVTDDEIRRRGQDHGGHTLKEDKNDPHKRA